MKIIWTADLHLSVYSNDKVDPTTGLSERLTGIKNAMHNMAEFALSNNIKNIGIAGDINHNKSVIYSLAQSILLDYVRSYKQLFFYIIDGNHDMSTKSANSVSSLKALDNEGNVDMIHVPKKVENMLLVPWHHDALSSIIKRNSEDFLVSHFGLNEAQLSSGISIVSDLKLSDLKDYKKCILGHYHKPQEVGNVIYCGSLTQLDWGEKHEDKRFLVVDTDNGNIQSIESEGYKKFYSFQLTNDNATDLINTGQELLEKGHNVVFEKIENFDVSKFSEDLKIIDKTEQDVTNRGLNISMSKQDIIDNYMKINETSDDDWDLYKSVALEIIDEYEGLEE